VSDPGVVLMETTRDAFQGIQRFIPTEEKIAHIETLVSAGFRRIDFGSFVSPRAVPQMSDSEAVLAALAPHSDLHLAALVVNLKGLARALSSGRLNALGFPFSVSDTFLLRNTGKGIDATWPLVPTLVRATSDAGIELLLYLSMAFGNPYGEPWSLPILEQCVRRCSEAGVRIVYLADTTSEATPAQIRDAVRRCRELFPSVDLGVHLHSDPSQWQPKLEAALDAGATRVDSAMLGMGGCPFARNELVGNVPSEGVIDLLESRGVGTGVERSLLPLCRQSAARILEAYGTV
jgi:hydroxymethylglutaryl-CoA lyase